MKLKKLFLYGAGAMLGLLAFAQLVPYGRAHTNPPVVREPRWDSPRTRELAVRACFDCHSNETRWPWYSNVAPVSWLVQRDVDEGRAALNFSRFDQSQKEAHESAEAVLEGEMPPWFYLPTHPEARLTADEQAELVRGLRATFGGD
ncbi:MAG: heme-binding domain-containing protein [Planctomycetes bacterium]|nr:heme-binding domain-containing protein [Planctomycetota bacterium]